ncbi:MAG: hydrogenase maturation protease [Pseudobdellovibrionaceae bacterium]
MSLFGKILVQAIGNPLRSDDGVGPLLIERMSERMSQRSDAFLNKSIDFEWVYQLQIENAEQWRGYESVIVVDADSRATDPFTWREITHQEQSAAVALNSHLQSPDCIYQLMREFFEQNFSSTPTRVFVLGIQAKVFDLGEKLSSHSSFALCEAEKFLMGMLKDQKNPLKAL